MNDCGVWNHESAEIETIIRQLWHYGDILSLTTVEEMLSNPNANLTQWARDLQATAGVSPSMVELVGFVEISEFSDSEDEGEDEDEGVEEEIFDTEEDWEAPLSETLSDSEDEDIPDGMQCIICHGSRQVTVQFGSCSHMACNTCLRGIYRSRRRADGHFPTWFPCHSCRAETCYIGELSLQPDFCGTAARSEVHGVYTIWNWVPVRRWIAKRSRMVAKGLRDKARTACDT